MRAFLIRFGLMLILFFNLAACGVSQIQPSPTSTSIPKPQPTDTLVPTNTSTPTSTPIPTAAITPTPTIQPGATRANPESGSEEVYTIDGEWIMLVHNWDLREHGSLPIKVTTDNAWIEEHEDGSVSLRFTLDDPKSPDHGKEFEYLIPSIGYSELLNLQGELVPVQFSGIVFPDSKSKPVIKMVDENNTRLAAYSFDSEQWLTIYTNLVTDFDSQDEAITMPDELGIYNFRHVISDNLEGMAGTQDNLWLTLFCKPTRIFDWRLFDSEQFLAKTVVFVESACNKEEQAKVFIPIWDDSATYGWDGARVFEYSADSGNWDYVEGSDSRKTKAEMISFMQKSSKFTIWIIIQSEDRLHMDKPGQGVWTTPYKDAPGFAWGRVTSAKRSNRELQLKWVNDVMETGISDVEGVIFGAETLNFVLDAPPDEQ